MLKEKMETLTGNSITDSGLKLAIARMNRIRDLLFKIGELRKAQRPPISGSDFIRLNHLSFCFEHDQLIGLLEGLSAELQSVQSPFSGLEPRILIAGNVIAAGDYVVPNLN